MAFMNKAKKSATPQSAEGEEIFYGRLHGSSKGQLIHDLMRARHAEGVSRQEESEYPDVA